MKPLRTLWTRLLLRRVHASHKYEQLDSLYMLEDPWDMKSEREQARFRETARIVRQNIGRVSTMLEIGAGEGHQSLTLTPLCNRLTGVDISRRAVERAKERVPVASFHAGDIFAGPLVPNEGEFDLVLACEVLSYLPDIARAIQRIDTLGDWKLVTYWDGHNHLIAPVLDGIPNVHRDTITHDDAVWHVAWWRGHTNPTPELPTNS